MIMDLTRSFGALRAFAATLPPVVDVEEREAEKVEGRFERLFHRHDKDAA